jgi:arginase
LRCWAKRDSNYRREIGVASIADRVLLHSADELRHDLEPIAAQAAAHVAAAASGWWLHVDLDVLDGAEFGACGAAGDPSMPQGLSWAELTHITRTALQADGCRGWSLGVYNPDLDPDGREAKRIVAYLADATRDDSADCAT